MKERLICAVDFFCYTVEPLCLSLLKKNINLDCQIPSFLCKELDGNYQLKPGLRVSVLGDNEADKSFGFTALCC